jgi:hypothetical protein
MAQSAREYAGRDLGQPGKRDSAGFGYQPALANLFLHYEAELCLEITEKG